MRKTVPENYKHRKRENNQIILLIKKQNELLKQLLQIGFVKEKMFGREIPHLACFIAMFISC